MFNTALWLKAIVEARLLLAACTSLMLGFNWLYVWVTSQVKLGALREFMLSLPENFQGLAGMPINDMATVSGRIAMAYLDPVVMFATAVWAIARGSDVVSGEINRGTMEMLLAQPVRRLDVLLTQSAVTVGGAVIIALAGWLGIYCGLASVTLEETVDPWMFVLPTLNVFSMTFFLAGVSALVSSGDRYRWRTVGLLGGFYVLALVLEVLGKMVKWLEWLRFFTFLAAYEPQQMITKPAEAWALSFQYDGLLVGLGLASYVAASLIFCHRDMPAPI